MRATLGDFWLGFDAGKLTRHLRDLGFSEIKTFLPGTDSRHIRLSALCAMARKA